MTSEEAIALLKECQRNRNVQNAHIDADTILCIFLKELGYDDVIEEYNKVDKQYSYRRF